MSLNTTQYSTSRFDVGGKRKGESTYDIYLYGERSLYRPGETIHLAGIVRDYDWKLTNKMPIKLVLKSPDGKEYATSRTQLDEQGMFTTAFEVSSTSVTGSYLAEAYTGNDIYLGSKSFLIEEFMPDRIKVD